MTSTLDILHGMEYCCTTTRYNGKYQKDFKKLTLRAYELVASRIYDLLNQPHNRHGATYVPTRSLNG